MFRSNKVSSSQRLIANLSSTLKFTNHSADLSKQMKTVLSHNETRQSTNLRTICKRYHCDRTTWLPIPLRLEHPCDLYRHDIGLYITSLLGEFFNVIQPIVTFVFVWIQCSCHIIIFTLIIWQTKHYQKVKTISKHVLIFQKWECLSTASIFYNPQSGRLFLAKIHIFSLILLKVNSWPIPISNLIQNQYCKVIFVVKPYVLNLKFTL